MQSPDLSEFVSKSSNGILVQIEDDCKKQQAHLSELLSKQAQLLHAVQNETTRFNAMDCTKLDDMIIILKMCQLRLQDIKDRMRKASTKSAKLKARSLKLLQIKQKAALERVSIREAQLTKELEMVAKSSTLYNQVRS